MSARLEADAAQGYFRSSFRPKKPVFIAGALASAGLAIATLGACNSPEEVSVTPSPSQTPGLEVTPTPAETERPKPPEDFPVLSDAERISWESALESFRKTENSTGAILVENEQVRISTLVQSIDGTPEMSINIVSPGSFDNAGNIKNLWLPKLCDAVAPAIPQGVKWIIVANPNVNPGSIEDREAFENNTICPEK